ncbi:hypothetical protein SAMN04489724_3260 [Algoriphagus locisalis]|uniref:Collagen triple helix repeat-containing protein n=1 Tax=Algoriphagus locisalis TaxID=305507 RepID=A0A1I7CJI3_9BACT|nr:hypothetical protein [Algoriphagus locisalis]SFT99563.1 hypothetical protein SAMN04489724_3260 [Algoriphagus locisalis]
MKNINLLILALFGMFVFQACEGPEGPQGIPGEPGVNIVGSTYEVEVNFTSANNYAEVFDFTEPLVDGDALLVYMLEENPAFPETFAWRLVPQTFYLEQGILVYNFDYTVDDFSIFLDNSPIDFTTLDPYYTTDLLFRAVVVPSDLIQARVDYTDYDATMKLLNISEDDFVRIEPKK